MSHIRVALCDLVHIVIGIGHMHIIIGSPGALVLWRAILAVIPAVDLIGIMLLHISPDKVFHIILQGIDLVLLGGSDILFRKIDCRG